MFSTKIKIIFPFVTIILMSFCIVGKRSYTVNIAWPSTIQLLESSTLILTLVFEKSEKIIIKRKLRTDKKMTSW